MPGRLLADVDALLMDILMPATGLGVGHHGELLPADYMNRLPFVHSYRWGGAAVDARFLDQATIDVHCRALGRTAALDLGETCRTALYEAWESQSNFEHGSISRWEEQAAPTEVRAPTQPDGLTVVQATYRLWVCPPVQF